MRWPVLVGAMLIAAGPAAASSPLVYKAPPPAQPVHLHSPARENDLFPRFLEWLKRQASLTSTVLHYFEEAQSGARPSSSDTTRHSGWRRTSPSYRSGCARNGVAGKGEQQGGEDID
jgi:hypothetical protein